MNENFRLPFSVAIGFLLLSLTSNANQAYLKEAKQRDATPSSENAVRTSPVIQVQDGTTIPDLRSRRVGTDWPGFLGPTHDGKSSERFDLKPWPKSGPPVVWHKKIGSSYGAPSISRGWAFLFDRHGDFARLTAMHSETGKEIWRFEYPTDYQDLYNFDNGPRTCPVVDGDRVYIYGAEGMLHCLDARDGRLLWKVDTQSKFNVVQNFFGVGSTPVVGGELLIVQVGGSPAGGARDVLAANGRVVGNGSGIVAFNKRTGEVVYSITDELASYASPTLATIDGRRWGFMFTRGGLVGFEPQTGGVDFFFPWRAERLESVNAANPVVAKDLVFVSESYGPGSAVVRVQPGKVDVVWKDPRPKREKSMLLHWNTAIHHKGYLYGCHGMYTNGAALRCIEMATGRVVWSHTVNERSSLIYVNEHFISLGEYGTLMLLRATPEKADILSTVNVTDEQGQLLIEYPAWAAPALSNGYLYVRGKDRLVCLDLMF